ncbi:MAG: hypothetical protein M3347_04510, partial [Armatimonadota bacterium]|nr:hypothetical protein [Armatimonadota bacterium]
IKLGPFPEAEAHEFAAAPRPGVAFTTEQVEAILRRGQRHPLRLQILCWHVAQASHEGRQDWETVWQEAQAEIDGMLGG